MNTQALRRLTGAVVATTTPVNVKGVCQDFCAQAGYDFYSFTVLQPNTALQSVCIHNFPRPSYSREAIQQCVFRLPFALYCVGKNVPVIWSNLPVNGNNRNNEKSQAPIKNDCLGFADLMHPCIGMNNGNCFSVPVWSRGDTFAAFSLVAEAEDAINNQAEITSTYAIPFASALLSVMRLNKEELNPLDQSFDNNNTIDSPIRDGVCNLKT